MEMDTGTALTNAANSMKESLAFQTALNSMNMKFQSMKAALDSGKAAWDKVRG